jgi:hypothetical protein
VTKVARLMAGRASLEGAEVAVQVRPGHERAVRSSSRSVFSFTGTTLVTSPVISVVIPCVILDRSAPVPQQPVLGVSEHVDEPGRHHQSRGVDGVARRAPGSSPTAAIRSPRWPRRRGTRGCRCRPRRYRRGRAGRSRVGGERVDEVLCGRGRRGEGFPPPPAPPPQGGRGALRAEAGSALHPAQAIVTRMAETRRPPSAQCTDARCLATEVAATGGEVRLRGLQGCPRYDRRRLASNRRRSHPSPAERGRGRGRGPPAAARTPAIRTHPPRKRS